MLAIQFGEHLQEELDALGMNAAKLAWQGRVPTNPITQVVRSDRDLWADTGMWLEHFSGTAANSA